MPEIGIMNTAMTTLTGIIMAIMGGLLRSLALCAWRCCSRLAS
jgi:hypothetical protein